MAGLGPGQMVEVTTVDERGSVDGTALFATRAAYPADGCGQYLEVTFVGASSPRRAIELSA
eukprot:7864424-Lingulodinium_polyedra.AAC.1